MSPLLLSFSLTEHHPQGCSDGGMRADDAADVAFSSDDEEACEERVPAAQLGYDQGEEEGEDKSRLVRKEVRIKGKREGKSKRKRKRKG